MAIRIKHKKKFGQHFLEDQFILDEIIKSIPEEQNMAIVEVGPGAGALTAPLLEYVWDKNLDFKAIEIDDEKVNYLHKKYPDKKDQILLQDFLKSELPMDQFLLIGNFPYNISSQIVFRLIEWKEHIPVMIGMFQKEVGDRLYSLPSNKSYGILSVILQTFYDTEAVVQVPPEAFDPPPKVDSIVVKSTTNNNKYSIQNPSKYIKFVKQGFGQRRKTLRNNFKSRLDKDDLLDDFFNRRAESLSVEEWVEFYKKYNPDG